MNPRILSSLRHRNELLTELRGQPSEHTLLGLDHLGLVASQSFFDVVHNPLTMTRQNSPASLRAKAM